MRKSILISLVAVFGGLHTVLYFLSFGLWRNWAIYLAPIEGIILGPQAGFLAALLGGSIARTIRPDVFWIFGLVAEPVSVMIAGLLWRGKWKPSFAVYAILLLAYFAHPFGRALPAWTIIDVLVAFVLLYPAAKLSNRYEDNLKTMPALLILVSFTCTATDSLVRIFMLVPAGFYRLFPEFFGSYSQLYLVFTLAAINSYVEDLVVVAISLIVAIPILVTISRLKLLEKKSL